MDGIELPLRLVKTGSAIEVADYTGRTLLVAPYNPDAHPSPCTEAQHLARAAALAITQACASPALNDEEVDAVLSEFDGDPRAAIAALLKDLETLARDADRVVSRGYVRGKMFGRAK